MRYKFGLAAAAIIALVIISSRDKETGSPANGDPALTRKATNVVMFERKRDSGKTMAVSAKQVVETEDQVAHLTDFHLVQQKGVQIIGKDARYDRKRSMLEVKGPVSIKTGDSAQARLDGLIWDRGRQKAYTTNPVSLTAREGTMVADRAEFSDGFSQIALIGHVHAKISRNILNR